MTTMTCLSCDKTRDRKCSLGRRGFPRIGARCAGFSYEPGTHPAEWASEAEYLQATDEMVPEPSGRR